MRRLAPCLVVLAVVAGCNNWSPPEHDWPASPEVCALGPQAESFAAFDKMPRVIASDFLARLTRLDFDSRHLIAERDQDFNWSDLIMNGLPRRRFVQGGHLGDRWFIWYETGGFGPYITVAVYQLDDVNARPALLGLVVQAHFRERPCEKILDFLNRRGAEPGPIPYGL